METFGRTRFGLYVLSIVAALLFGVAPAAAHRPYFNLDGSPDPARPYVLEDVDVSQVVYGGFAAPGRVDYYELTVPAGFAADIQLVVPAVATCNAFRPTLTIAGSGLKASGPLPAALATPLAGDPAVVLAGTEWGTFFEPFTGTTYATSPRFTATLAGGRYLIAVTEPDGDTGTYGLALGGSEKLGGDPLFLLKIGKIDACEPPALAATPIPS